MQKSFEHFCEKCIDDDNVDNAKGLIEDMRKMLKYVGCKNIIEFVSNKRKYNLKPPLYPLFRKKCSKIIFLHTFF